jgi:hypothetical protein
MKRALALAVLAALGCRKTADATGPSQADAAPATGSEESGSPASAVRPSRCRPAGEGLSVAAPEDLELGDALPFADGYAIGMVHRTSAGRVGAVALVSKDATAVRVVDLGPTLGDAPPPRLASRGSDLLAAGYVLPHKSDARELAVQVVAADGGVRPLTSIAQQRDDSFAFDLAGGLVTWDEATPAAIPRGVVRIAELQPDHPAAPHDVSPADSDAEMPRIVPFGRDVAKSFVMWMSQRPEPAHAPDASASEEAPGEVRTQSWLEAVVVDAAGAPVGPVRRLTPATGHVSAYDVQLLAGESRPTLLVVARDDGEAVDGSGGVLLRVRMREDGIDPPLALPGDGLGRGAPTLVEAPSPWLAWVGPHEELRLMPLDPAGAPIAQPSAEPLLDEARPLAVVGQGGDRMLVATPGDAAAPLRLFACVR